MTDSPEIVIVGGGIIGLTTAYTLAKQSRRVTLLDRAELGQEASWAGAGIIPPGNPNQAQSPIDKLRAISVNLLSPLSQELLELTSIDNGYHRCGGIELLSPDEQDAVNAWHAESLNVEQLSPDQLRQREPNLTLAEGLTAYELPAFAQVRNPWHLRALIAACERVGVVLLRHRVVTGWQVHQDRVEAVRTETGPLFAQQFLLCAGAWSDSLLSPLGLHPEIHPIKGQMILFQCGEKPIERIVMLGKRYLVPRTDGRVLVGSTEEPEAGFNKENTLESCRELEAFATSLVPNLRHARIEKTWSGLRPGSADDLPTIGPVPGFTNLILAAGHYRAGVQLSAATALGISELLHGHHPDWLHAFRFDRPRTEKAKSAFRS